MTKAGSPPKVSVVIPARNADSYIEETLQSLAGQTFAGFEALIFDDGSTDRTSEVVMAFQEQSGDGRFALFDGPARGVSAARNAGLERAKAPFTIFLDADDILSPDALERFVAVLEGSSCAAALGQVLRISEDGSAMPSPDNRALVPDDDQLAALMRKNYIVNGGALAVRTSCARDCGAYDETLRFGEDWEFWCRLLSAGPLAVVPGPPVLSYRQIPGGANHQAKGSVFARGIPCLSRIADNPDMKARFGARLPRMLRARRIDIFWSGVRTRFQYDSKTTAALIAFAGLFVFPDSLARPGLALRFLKSIGG